ncbi:hypothetical protein T439DRAFT_320434 [Meredithblackwellia eburnea MCA 4105]
MLSIATPALNGWHSGERKLQQQLMYADEVDDAFSHISSTLPAQHRLFHSSNIAFLPFATKSSKDGRVWCSILCPGPEVQRHSGEFIISTDPSSLMVLADVWEGDPLRDTLENGGLVAGVGIETETRRRNKLAGNISQHAWNEGKTKLGMVISITEALGNCPKYINLFPLEPFASKPVVAQTNLDVRGDGPGLPDDLISFIHSSSTLYLATSSGSGTPSFPSHLGCNHRGGPRGFVRVVPSSAGRQFVIPDFSGNRFMSSLGNVELDPHVGIAFPDFATGDILYITGEAKNYLGNEAARIMERSKLVTVVDITGFVFVKDALTTRIPPGVKPEPSPYSPRIRFLVEEKEKAGFKSGGSKGSEIEAKLVRMEKLREDIARFSFEVDEPMEWKPGQYVVLDCLSLLGGEVGYQHMAYGNEKSVNEDGVRTWTISSAPSRTSPQSFSITLRHPPRGLITTQLFHRLNSTTSLPPLTLPVLGMGGEFLLPTGSMRKMLWMAGGIGITPFLAFLGSLSQNNPNGEAWDVQLLVATREPEVMVDLVDNAIGPTNLAIDLHLFSPNSTAPSIIKYQGGAASATVHPFRLGPAFFASEEGSKNLGGALYLCGPPPFEEAALKAVESAGVDIGSVVQERFNF